MQKVSNEYVESMKQIKRNRGYIKVTLGVINSEAQDNLQVSDDADITYFSDESVIKGILVTQEYATCEQDWSKVDGNMYFLPTQGSGATLYPNGIISEDIKGRIVFDFANGESYDIAGFTIDFGENYPIDFTIASNNEVLTFTDNDTRYFSTELGLHGISQLTITATKIRGGEDRLRIYGIQMGVSNTFTNEDTINYTETSYVSPIAESLPSTDISVTVENYDQYYNPDNPNSVLAFFEVGQEVKTQFGYDVNDDGEIEWLPEKITHLKTWQATDRDATFTATDAFDNMSGTYYGGKYYTDGITLYDLALDVLADAGIENYKIDTSLNEITVHNPLPAVAHTEALQIIANAGRCTLREDRDGMIYIESTYIPDIRDFTLSCNGETEYSNVQNIANEDDKIAYGLESQDFTRLSDSYMEYMGTVDLSKVGYVSSEICNASGVFGTNPIITLELGSGYAAPAFNVKFRNVAPQELIIHTYFDGQEVETLPFEVDDLSFSTIDGFEVFDTLVVEFTKGSPNSRITIDRVWFGSPTDYILRRNMLYDSPIATREDRIKSFVISMFNYKSSSEDVKDLVTSTIKDATAKEYVFNFMNPSYGYQVEVTEGTATAGIVSSSAYQITIALSGVSTSEVKVAIKGYEYQVDEQFYTVQHNTTGIEKPWSNPLISDADHAELIEAWLADFFLGDVEYTFDWRGDPRVDASDLFNLELKTGEVVNVRNYQNTLEFSGGWTGSMKARKVFV